MTKDDTPRISTEQVAMTMTTAAQTMLVLADTLELFAGTRSDAEAKAMIDAAAALRSVPDASAVREATLRKVLEEIANHPESKAATRIDESSYAVSWAFWNVQHIVRAALASQQSASAVTRPHRETPHPNCPCKPAPCIYPECTCSISDFAGG